MNSSPDIQQTDGQRTFNVASQRIARVYAESLLAAAEPAGQADEVLEELQSLIDDVFAVQPELEALLCGGAIGRDRRAALIREAFEGRASRFFLNFLLVLNHHERLGLLRAVRAAAQELSDQRKRRLRVLVQTAVPLPDDQRQKLDQELRELFHLEPVLEQRVDPELLGGLTVRVGDWLYDGSVRTQLNNIRKQLIERSTHEIQSRRDHFSAD